MTDFQKLILELESVKPYPKSMEKVTGEIKRTAFFPGGRGLFQDNDENVANKKIMVLGQDFDTKAKFEKSKEEGSEDIQKNKTWKNLLETLKATGVSTEDCFFTNAIMGVRLSESAIGISPGFKDHDFLKRCQDFFLFQLAIQKPQLIIVLGIKVAKFLAPLSNQLSTWSALESFKKLDVSNQNGPIKNVHFDQLNFSTSVALIMHPSARAYNLNNRIYKGLKGKEAESQIIREAFSISNS